MAVYEGSRYLKTTLYRYTSKPQLRIRQPVKFNLTNSETYVYKIGDRIDSVAHKIYGSAQLYWAIMDANPQYFSELEIQPGDVLVIPLYSEVMKYV